jgi:hypothetical protein
MKMRVDALTQQAIQWINIRKQRRDERKINYAISKKNKLLMKTESPIVRFRLNNEIRDMRQKLRRFK